MEIFFLICRKSKSENGSTDYNGCFLWSRTQYQLNNKQMLFAKLIAETAPKATLEKLADLLSPLTRKKKGVKVYK